MTSPFGDEAPDRRLWGITLGVTGFGFFAVIDTSAKVLGDVLPLFQLVFVRYLAQMIILLAVFVPRDGRALFRTRAPKIQLLRAVFVLSTTLFNFLALMWLPLSVTSALFFTTPLFVCALSVPLLGERIGSRRLVAILIGFLGVLIVVRPGLGLVHWAVIFSVIATLSFSLYVVFTRMLSGLDTSQTQQIYSSIFCVFVTAPFALLNWHWPETEGQWAAFGVIMLLGTLGQQIFTMAHRYAPASTIAPFIYSQIFYISLIDIVVFAIFPDRYMILGALVIAASGVYLWIRERQLGRQTFVRKEP